MAVITISRGTFAGGEKLAQLLANQLSYSTISREQLYEKVREWYGFDTDSIAEIFEQVPSVRASNVSNQRERLSVGERRRQVFLAVQASLCELLRKDNVVYHGYAGHLLLPGISHLLRVRLIAPRSKRIELAMAEEGLTRIEASRKIDQVDSERARWTSSFFGVNWGDPLLFDMVLNLDGMSLEEVCEVVLHAEQLPRFRTTEASAQAMENLALSSRVAARLHLNPPTAGLSLDVSAEDGLVKLVGPAPADNLETVLKFVRGIEGVRAVERVDRLG